MSTHEKRKMVTIYDILIFLKDFKGDDTTIALGNRYSLTEAVAEGMLDAAEDLGYIDEHDCLTLKGQDYLADCSRVPEEYGVLTLVRGLPGSGKTELGKRLDNSRPMATRHIEADQFMVDENGEYKFQPDKVKSVNVECVAQAEKYLRLGYDVVVTNVFAQYWEVKPYYDVAAELGIKTILITMQAQFHSEHRSSRTRQQMVEKWDDIFLPRSWNSHNKEKVVEPPGPTTLDDLMAEAVNMPLED